MDGITRKVKITTHCVFDEAGMTIPEADRSSANRALQQHGYSTKLSEFPEQESSNRPPIMADFIQQNIAWIKLLSNQAKMPSRATEDSAGSMFTVLLRSQYHWTLVYFHLMACMHRLCHEAD
jgi:hypothetical protein